MSSVPQPAQPSQTESRASTLPEAIRTSIQTWTEEWLGSLPREVKISWKSTLLSGINQISLMVARLLSSSAVRDAVMDSLEWGDGSMDLVQYASEVTKQQVLDVLTELKSHLDDGGAVHAGPGDDPASGYADNWS